MKTAITIWNDRVSPVFDVTGKALLYISDGKRICSEQQLFLADGCAATKVACLLEVGTDVLICGAISRDAHSAATHAGIRVYPFIAGGVGEVLQAFLAGTLVDDVFAMPGCACKKICPGRRNQGRGRAAGSAFFSKQETR